MNRYHRRDILKMGAAALLGSMLPFPALAAISNSSTSPRTLAFFNTHTAESVEECYFKQGAYQPDALARINYVLRDHRCDAITSIDPKLLDVLHAVKSRVGRDEPFHVISGYRTPKSNELLRRSSKGGGPEQPAHGGQGRRHPNARVLHQAIAACLHQDAIGRCGGTIPNPILSTWTPATSEPGSSFRPAYVTAAWPQGGS